MAWVRRAFVDVSMTPVTCVPRVTLTAEASINIHTFSLIFDTVMCSMFTFIDVIFTRHTCVSSATITYKVTRVINATRAAITTCIVWIMTWILFLTDVTLVTMWSNGDPVF